VSDA
jgi:hypothetical protein